MLTDAAALLLALMAFRIGRRASDGQRTFGYMRLEVVAGFVNALLLFALTAWIVYEAIQRFMTPHQVLAGPMFVVAVLGLVVTDEIYGTLPEAGEGQLSRVRATVVCAPALAEMAVELDLGAVVLLGKGEAASGGRERPSILADAMEAVIGAPLGA